MESRPSLILPSSILAHSMDHLIWPPMQLCPPSPFSTLRCFLYLLLAVRCLALPALLIARGATAST